MLKKKLNAKLWVIFASFVFFAGADNPAFARSKIDTLFGSNQEFYMHGRFVGKDKFQIGVNFSNDPSNAKAEEVYSGTNLESTLDQFYDGYKKSKRGSNLPFCLRFDEVLDLPPGYLTAFDRIASGKIVDRVMPRTILANDNVREDVSFTAWRKNSSRIEFRISVGVDRLFAIRSGSGANFSAALKDALLNQRRTPRTKVDAMIYMNDHFYAQGDFSNKKFNLKVNLTEARDHLESEVEYSGHDFVSAFIDWYKKMLDSKDGLKLTPPVEFASWIDPEVDTRELERILKDTSRGEKYLFSVARDKYQIIQFQIRLDNSEHSLIRSGSALTLSDAIKNALLSREAIPKSKMDGLVQMSSQIYMQGGYFVSPPERLNKTGKFWVEAKSDFGYAVGEGANFQGAMGDLFEKIKQTEWGKSAMPLLNFKDILHLETGTLENFERLLKDDLFPEPLDVLFTVNKSPDGQVLLNVQVGLNSGRPELVVKRSGSGTTLSGAISGLLEARNVIPVGQEYLAMESVDLSQQYMMYYMTPKEREQTSDYQAFADSNPDGREFTVEHPGTFVKLAAEQFCKHHRYNKVDSYLTQYSYKNYSEKEDAGKVFTISFDSFETIRGEKQPVKWKLSEESMEIIKTEFSTIPHVNWKFCPHIVFEKLYCAH